jgi:crotonobetainyl-CoA:carnitine CoA-transferase CaiB-like acyl-CoA transferase
MPLELRKLVVVELTEAIAGPTTGEVFADLGATVIKIENPNRGDTTRHQGEPKLLDSGSLFHVLNRGKRSVGLDLKQERARALLTDFVAAEADVVVQNFRPGAAERLGLGPERITALAPRVVYCSLSGFPQNTPSEHKPGYDLILQAFSGILQTTGEPDRDPVRLGISAIDLTAGLWAVIAILDALIRREATGKGGIVSTSLLESAVFMMSAQIGQFQFSGTLPRRWGTGLKEFIPLRVYPTKDGMIALAAATDKLFGRLGPALGVPGLADDGRFDTLRNREKNRVELDRLIEARLATETTRKWLEVFDRASIPVSPVNSVRDLLESAELNASGQLVSLDGMEGFKVVAAPYRIDGVRPVAARRSERLGESTAWFAERAVRKRERS